ncbi:MAG: nucleoside deaminase [Candidatus Limnocylindrales bacterium]
MNADDLRLLRLAIDVAARARARGNHPFGAVLASAQGEVLLEGENTVATDEDVMGHAELNLVRQASRAFTRDELASTSLYSSTEPCAMCSGAIYWSGIGRVVYALPEARLGEFTGADPENPTMHLSARAVLGAGQREIVVEGPADLPEAADVHADFWDPEREDHRG